MTNFLIPNVIAHRGASGNYPENTLLSFLKAKEKGAKWIEFDVQLSACHTPIIFHDKYLRRTTNGHGFVKNKPYDELSRLDAGSWFNRQYSSEKIPTLEEVIYLIINNNLGANIEVKPVRGKEKIIVDTISTLLIEKWPANYKLPLISSSNIDIISMFKEKLPDFPRAYVFDFLPRNWKELAQKNKCYSLNCWKKNLTEKKIKSIKKEGYKVLSYTINSKEEADKLYGFGVDSIFSDYPEEMLEVV